MGDNQLRAGCGCGLVRQVESARLLGVREIDGGEVAVRMQLSINCRRARHTSLIQYASECLPTHTVHRRVGNLQVGWLGAQHLRGLEHIRINERLAHLVVLRAARQLVHPHRGGDPLNRRRNLSVCRRHDLRARILIAEVYLVPVIPLRVVGCGHHHTGCGLQMTHRKCQHRGGQRSRHQHCAHTGGLHQLGRVASVHIGVRATVIADHHGRRIATFE